MDQGAQQVARRAEQAAVKAAAAAVRGVVRGAAAAEQVRLGAPLAEWKRVRLAEEVSWAASFTHEVQRWEDEQQAAAAERGARALGASQARAQQSSDWGSIGVATRQFRVQGK